MRARIAVATPVGSSLCGLVTRTHLAVLALLLASGVAFAGETITCSYDARGRLVQVVRTDAAGNTVQTTYSYDQANNRTVVTTTGSGNPPPP
jgi:YD repeat-containing protein